MAPSEVIAMRRGRASARGNGYSVSWNVSGSTVPILLVPNSTNHGRPEGSSARPYGRLLGLLILTRRAVPVATVNFPTKLPPCTVNQMSPWRSQIMVCGSHAAESGRENFLILLSLGSSRPIWVDAFPEYHTLPVAARVGLCGPGRGARPTVVKA